jgi:hypothetical protein
MANWPVGGSDRTLPRLQGSRSSSPGAPSLIAKRVSTGCGSCRRTIPARSPARRTSLYMHSAAPPTPSSLGLGCVAGFENTALGCANTKSSGVATITSWPAPHAAPRVSCWIGWFPVMEPLARIFHTHTAGWGRPAYRAKGRILVGRVTPPGALFGIQGDYEMSGLWGFEPHGLSRAEHDSSRINVLYLTLQKK